MNLLQKIIDAIWAFIGGRKSHEDLEAELDRKAAGKNLDWRNSVVDLMKLTGQDSSLEHRKALAKELGYPGPYDGSAQMNIWLKQRIMERLS